MNIRLKVMHFVLFFLVKTSCLEKCLFGFDKSYVNKNCYNCYKLLIMGLSDKFFHLNDAGNPLFQEKFTISNL